eukprot:gene3683-4238_t
MIRQTLRLFSTAAHAVKPAPTVAAVGHPGVASFFADANLRAIDVATPVLPAANASDADIEMHFNKLMNNPLFQTDAELMKSFRDYESSLSAMEAYVPLPNISAAPITINWEFKKNFIPAKTVDYIRGVFQESINSIDTWEADEQKMFASAEKEIEDSVKPLDDLIPEIEASLKTIQFQLDEAEDLKNRLTTITIEEILQKNPEFEDEIYEDITHGEWMIKDRVGHDTIYDYVKNHGHGGH